MYDVLTTAAMVDELREHLLDGRVQKLGMVDPLTIAAEVYANGRRQALVASADASHPRLYRASSLPSFDTSIVTPFSLQIRKYVRGGFIIDITQPLLERVVELTIARRLPDAAARRGAGPVEDDDNDDVTDEEDIWGRPDVVRTRLVVEIMGRHSNLILVGEDGLVMESAKRVTPDMSRVRPVLPKREYTPPPPPETADPRRVTGPGIELVLAEEKPSRKLQQALVRGLRAMSPQMAREVAYNVTGNADSVVGEPGMLDSQEIAREVRRLFEPMMLGGWQPAVYRRGHVVSGYSAVAMAHLAVDADEERVETMSEAVEGTLEGARQEAPRDHEQLRRRLVGRIGDARERLASRLRSLRNQQKRAEEADRFRHAGEMIYAYIWMIEPGQTVLEIEGEEPIALDPSLDANGNAQAYFERYRKAQRGLEQVPVRIEAADREDAYLRQLATQAEQSQGFNTIEALTREFEEYLEEHPSGRAPDQRGQPQKKRKPSGQGSRPDQFRTPGGHLIYVGHSGRQNDQVTFSIGGPDDTWLHARGVAGSHVIIRWDTAAEEQDSATIETAAALAGWYSAARASGSVDVDVAERRHVRKISGAGPGMVTYRNEHTIVVAPQGESALREAGRIV
ncbi:MAG TPA: NFACT RNA binding domain-containing protein [Thermomicrobiales bacterium]|nr:NFACT RNA binding domain-containing protein [Thermomicrobiales bacterium]